MGTVQDITTQKEAQRKQEQLAQELREQLEQVNALQRAMTHEGWHAFMTARDRFVHGFTYTDEKLDSIAESNIQHYDEFTTSDTSMTSPLQIRGETIGVLGAQNPNGEPLTAEQQALLTALTSQVAETLERARLFEETEMGRQQLDEQAQELTIINQISEIASSEVQLDDLLQSIGKRLQQTFAAETVSVSLYNEKTGMISAPYYESVSEGLIDPPDRHISEPSFSAKIIQSGKTTAGTY